VTDTTSTFGSTGTDESTTEQAKDQVRDKAQVAQDKARGALGQARGRLGEQVEQRSTWAGEQLHSTAQDMRDMAEQLRSQGKDTPARVAEQVADRVESLGSYLRDADGDRLLGDVEAFARRQPWAVVAGGLALGFAASRLLKASSSRRYQAGYDRSFSGQGRYDETAAIEGASASSDSGTRTPYVRANQVPPVVGSYDLDYDLDPEAVTPATDPIDDPNATGRDRDPLA
jgi:hypothetical protein